LINNGIAKAHDLETLGEFVRQRVLETSGIKLNWEIRRVGTTEKNLSPYWGEIK
jgi:UDP-N-acetylmuramate dehydrogenase